MAVTLNASTSTGYIQTADTSGDLALQSNGTTQFTVSSTGAYGQIKSGTAVASTSGTAIDFTSIPSWVKRITVMFSGMSTNGTTGVLVQLGSVTIQTSGYTSYGNRLGTSTIASGSSSAGFFLPGNSATETHSGSIAISLFGSNVWTAYGGLSAGTYSLVTSGIVSLSGTLDRVRITTFNGTDTFDAGTINILYEG